MANQSINVLGRISHFFVVKRPLSLLVLLVMVAFGLIAFFLTPKQYNPEIIRPAFAIQLTYEGATIEEATQRVVYELVEKVRSVPGVDEVMTEVHDGATINTTVIFAVGYNPVQAELDLWSQLEQHSYLARGHLSAPTVMEVNPETIPVMQIAFSAPDTSIAHAREQVVAISQALADVADVSSLSVHGGYQPALVVEIDPSKLSAHAISLQQVSAALVSYQQRFVDPGIQSGDTQIQFVFDARATNPDEVGLISVSDGVLLRDIAEIYKGPAANRSYVTYQNDESHGEVVMLSVAKVEGSSAPVVTKAVRETIDEVLTKPAFANMSYQIVSDDGVVASAEITGLTQNLVTSIAIVALVLFLFLSARSAVVVLVAIPTTLLIVFGIGLLFDQTINRITLFALILSLGLLVDSAIVVVENIHSHLQEWKAGAGEVSRSLIIAKAVDEIGAGLVLSTLTSVIVFLPMHFISGMMGPYMGPIAFFVPVALLVSLLVAIVITPYVASYVLRSSEQKNFITRATERVMLWATETYTQFLRTVLYNHRKQQLILGGALGLLVLALLLPLFSLVHFQMLPKADRDQFYVYLDLPVGTSVTATAKHSTALSDILLSDSDVMHIQSFVGTAPIVDFNGLFKGAQNRHASHQATLRVNLTPANSRDRSSTEIVHDVRASLAQDATFADAVRLIEEPPGPPVQATLVAKVSGTTPEAEQAFAAAFADVLSQSEHVVDVDTSQTAPIGRVKYQLDQAAASELGVSPAAIQSVLRLLSTGQAVGEFQAADTIEYTPMVLRLPSETRNAPEDISALTVRSQSGETVPLVSVLTPVYEMQPGTVFFEDATSLTYVTAEVENQPIVYVVAGLMSDLITGKLAGYEVTSWNLFSMTITDDSGASLSLDWGGEWEMTLENFRDLGLAMGIALFAVYTILVAQYNRFALPAYILVTVPLALIGILFGFLIMDQVFGVYLTATALIGFIALIGIVVNNAIIFLEYFDQAMAKGAAFREALISAGEARLRPILLTSLTTVLGSLTIVSDPVWSGLAWSIVFGLSLSTGLTLVIYPILLVYFTSNTERIT